MEIPAHLLAHFEKTKEEFKQSLCVELDQYKVSMCRRVDVMFTSFLADLKNYNSGSSAAAAPAATTSTSGRPENQLATLFANAISVQPVTDENFSLAANATGGHQNHLHHLNQHQPHSSHHLQQTPSAATFPGSESYFNNSQPNAQQQNTTTTSVIKREFTTDTAVEDSTDIEENSIEAAAVGSDGGNISYSVFQFDLELDEFDQEDDGGGGGGGDLNGGHGDGGTFDPGDGDGFCLNNLYWINQETPYRSCLPGGRFSALNFDFGITSTEPGKMWTLQPAAAIKECQKNRGPTEKFPDYFKHFGNDIFKRLGDVYPYEVPRQVIDQVVTIFCFQYRVLNQYFQIFKRKWPNMRFSRCVNTIELLTVKIKNKFKVRANELKKEGLWIYRTPYEREKYGKVIDEAKKARRRWKPESSFDYVTWKPKMEEKMEQMVEEKAQKKEKKGGSRKKRKKGDESDFEEDDD